MANQELLDKIDELRHLFARARENPDAWVAGMRVLDKWEISLTRDVAPASAVGETPPQAKQSEEAAVERSWLHEAAGI